MDSVTAPDVAKALGISLPAAHRLFDQRGIPSFGKGRIRRAPRSLLIEVMEDRGAVPASIVGMSNSQLRVLAALSRAPFGLRSARQVADRAGVSPTVASRELKALQVRGLARHQQRVVASDRARAQTSWSAELGAWPSDLMCAVNLTVTPQSRRSDTARAVRVPAQFAHLFWNADFSRLDLSSDATYIAGRMLMSGNPAAWVWALENLRGDAIDSALQRRGTPPEVRALVNNWRARA